MNEELTALFEEIFGHPGNSFSDDEKFDHLQKAAYELGDGVILGQLRRIKDSGKIELSEETSKDFEDSLSFVGS